MTGPAFPRAREQIAARAAAAAGLFTFGNDVLLDYLPFDRVRPFLKEGTTAEQWHGPIGAFQGCGGPTDMTRPLDPADAAHTLLAAEKYAAFGWTKIEGHRGISASRTIEKMAEWLWILGWEPEDVFDTDADWGQYGAGCLVRACRRLGLPEPEDAWAQNMIEGRPCWPGCEEGCG